MRVLSYILIGLSLLLLGAHFLRVDNMVGVVAALALIGLLVAEDIEVADP